MSKAFTRESDSEDDEPLPPSPSSALPPGAKNYLTPDGAQRLRLEAARLRDEERPRWSGAGDDPLAKRRLQRIDLRIFQIEETLRTAVVTEPPPAAERAVVRFGAVVTVRRREAEATYRLVGVDETDLDQGWVSIYSPIAQALLNARLGTRVRFRFPSGEEELEILRIDYPET